MFYFNKDRDYLVLIPTLVVGKYWIEVDWLNMNLGIKRAETCDSANELIGE